MVRNMDSHKHNYIGWTADVIFWCKSLFQTLLFRTSQVNPSLVSNCNAEMLCFIEHKKPITNQYAYS